MTHFHQITPTLDSNWRAIVLFGRNVASYKFALASSLLEISEKKSDLVTLDELAMPFAKSICDHLKASDKQATSASSKFLDTCRSFNRGEIDQSALSKATVQRGFNNVIDAFHIVNGAEIGRRFFIDERETSGGIRLTEDLFRLRSELQASNLSTEVDARWRLVETSWEMGLARHLIEPDEERANFIINGPRRKTITSCRGALNGYQKGRCFYCFREIVLEGESDLSPDVDHFFPWVLQRDGHIRGLDGVWNLVLACRVCNRGASGKFARVPSRELLARLHARNNYLIDSHHPLRETLSAQSGQSELDRRSFLQKHFDLSIQQLHHLWQPKSQADSTF